MLALYLLALGFGSTLILASLLLGGHGEGGHDGGGDGAGDADHDAEHDHDTDTHEVEHHAPDEQGEGVWLPVLSLRFWTFGLATFGLGGTLLTLLSVPDVLTAVVSALCGVGFGTAAAYLFRALKRDQVSGDTGLDRLVGEEARVLLPIRSGQPGKIVLQTLAGRVELPATTRDAEPIAVGAQVLVAGVRDGVADVSRLLSADDDARRAKVKAAAQDRGSRERTEL